MNSALRRPPLVPRVDRAAPLQFLRTAYEADDWIAVFLKRYDTGEAVQRVGPVTWFQQAPVQAWLRLMNARHFNICQRQCPGARKAFQDPGGGVCDPPRVHRCRSRCRSSNAYGDGASA